MSVDDSTAPILTREQAIGLLASSDSAADTCGALASYFLIEDAQLEQATTRDALVDPAGAGA
jgi:hypothetical protein